MQPATKLLILSTLLFSFNAYGQGIQSRSSEEVLNCFNNYDSSWSDISSVDDIEGLANCISNATTATGNRTITSGTIGCSSDLRVIGECAYLLPFGNYGEEITLNNINYKNARCRKNFSCNGGTTWTNLSNVIQPEANTNYCEARTDYTISNPKFIEGDNLVDTYINRRIINSYNEGEAQQVLHKTQTQNINIPRLPSITNISNTEDNQFEYSYRYGGFEIQHNFNCVNNNLQETVSTQAINACDLSNIPNDFKLSTRELIQHPTNNQIRILNCPLFNPVGGVSEGQALRAALQTINSDSLKIVELESTLPFDLGYNFFTDDNDALFNNNITKSKIILACTDNSGWQIVSSTCSNITDIRCFSKYSETGAGRGEPYNDSVIGNFATSPVNISQNPYKRLLPMGRHIEEKLLYVPQISQNNSCFTLDGEEAL